MLDEVSIQNVRNAFQSILRSDYISISEIKQLEQLSEYYVDFYNNVPTVLQEQDSFICGRRGTGKTTLLMRAYYECLKNISPQIKDKQTILGDKKVLPIYIDLSQCKEIFEEDNGALIERNFLRRLVEEIKTQLENIFEESSFKFLKKDISRITEFEYIERVLIEGLTVKRQDQNILLKEKSSTGDELSVGIAIDKINVNGKENNTYEQETSKGIEELRGLNVQDFLSNISKIRKAAKLDAIYVFIDEFSDLTIDEQKNFSILLKKLLGSKINVFFKVGTITDRYNFGEHIIIGRDIFPISLDLSEFVERYGGIVSAMKVMEDFTGKLIEKRLKIFSPQTNFNDVFRIKKEEILARISREAMGVPRTIGLILQHSLGQAELNSADNRIALKDINFGMRATRKIYFQQFQGAIKSKLIQGHYMDMWNSILGKALFEKEKTKKNPRPSSHILLDPIRKRYFNILCENFIVHLIEESRASKYGGNYLLYAIDYDICLENNILYAEEKDEFTAVRFIYDNVLAEYDGYFMKDRIRSYRCPKCGKIYEEREVAKAKVKRCYEDDEKLEEILHREVPKTKGNYTEVEVKILGLISTLTKEDAMTAAEIADAVGCSRHKVANWGSRILAKKGLIEIERRGGKNYYFDKSSTI
ncbi:helix-turn-helix transcriptional regulator [Clostridium cochlearium]|uniref:helix-turn-helix transcriptional regulator n=1 Tax=Clostridium cochlearium TaxID=1494 RepID=UPI0022DF6DA7|nr:hypothetical protein [Clostridium cochlearium]